MSGTSGGSMIDAAVGGNIAANAATNNFLSHKQAGAMQQDFNACNKKPGGGTDADYTAIRNKYLALSNSNIAQVNSCILSGNVACVTSLEGQAASSSEISNDLVGADYTIFVGKQNTIQTNGSVNPNSLFGTDAQQAADVAKFRQSYCAGVSTSTCDGMVTQAIGDRQARAMIIGVAAFGTSALASGLRALRPSSGFTGSAASPTTRIVNGEVLAADGSIISRRNPVTGVNEPVVPGSGASNSVATRASPVSSALTTTSTAASGVSNVVASTAANSAATIDWGNPNYQVSNGAVTTAPSKTVPSATVVTTVANSPSVVDLTQQPGGVNFTGPLSPSQLAQSWQGGGLYSGVDNYGNTTLAGGTYVVGAAPGQSAYYTTLGGFAATNGTVLDYYQQLQVGPINLGGLHAGHAEIDWQAGAIFP